MNTLKLSVNKYKARAMANGEEADIKKGHNKDLYVLDPRRISGNGKTRDMLYGFGFVILVGLMGWNLKNTVDMKVDIATVKEKVITHEAWGVSENNKNNKILDIHEDRLDKLETGNAVATADRFTSKDAKEMEYDLKEWTRTNFVMK
jgi:hypothetical protein